MKVCLIGDSGVGKTCMSNSIIGNSFNQFSSTTIGALYLCKDYQSALDNKLSIWDTAGQERYRSLIPMYARCSNVLILVVCKEKYNWQESVSYWIDYYFKFATIDSKLLVIFSKVDKEDNKPNADDLKLINEILDQNSIEANILLHSSLTGSGLDIIHQELFKLSLKIRDSQVEKNIIKQTIKITNTPSKECCIIV